MNYTYFPSCNFTKASPQTALKTRNFFKDRMPVAGCCLYDKKVYSDEDIALILCQACRQQLETKIKTKTIWEYFDEDETFEFPNYHHTKMNLQDCFRDKDHPEVHQAVRNILKKMHIEVIEIEDNKEKSTFCGTLHFESKKQEIIELLKQYPNSKISQLPEDIQIKLMQEQVSKYNNDYYVICDCNRCLKGVTMGGAKGIHLLDLVMGVELQD